MAALDVMAVLLDGIHETVKRDGSLHRHAVSVEDMVAVLVAEAV